MKIRNVLSLFDGMSCGQLALGRAGINYENYYASEIDKYAISVTQHNYPNTIQLGSVVDVTAAKLPKIDLLIGGSPCQSFSFSGKMNGMTTKCGEEVTSLERYLELKNGGFQFEGQSYLFWEYVRLLKETNPKYFLLENVCMVKKWKDVITNILGVEPIMINSSLLSAQNRKRLYFTNIPNVVVPEDKKINLSQLVGEYEGIYVYPRGYNKGGCQWYKGKSPTISISSWEHNFFIQRKDGTKDVFTPEICEMLQTVPVGYTSLISKSKRIKCLGNGWTVDVIAHILKNIV